MPIYTNTSPSRHICRNWVDSYNEINFQKKLYCMDDLLFIENLSSNIMQPGVDVTKIGNQQWDTHTNEQGLRLKSWICNDCNLSGEVKGLYKLTGLNKLDLSNNSLNGILPGDICKLGNLDKAYFNNNSICPPYPDCLGADEISKSSQLCGNSREIDYTNVQLEEVNNIVSELLYNRNISLNISVDSNYELYTKYQYFDLNNDGVINHTDISEIIDSIITHNRAGTRLGLTQFEKIKLVKLKNKLVDKSSDNRSCNSSWKGDGCCDPGCNKVQYGWDNGDCCESTCTSGDFNCGDCGYDCQDPDAPENHGNDAPTGDVNLDGQTDIVDVIQLIQYILGLELLSPEQLFQGDMDGNGVVDIVDVISIINGILNGVRGTVGGNNPEIKRQLLEYRRQLESGQIRGGVGNKPVSLFADAKCTQFGVSQGIGEPWGFACRCKCWTDYTQTQTTTPNAYGGGTNMDHSYWEQPGCAHDGVNWHWFNWRLPDDEIQNQPEATGCCNYGSSDGGYNQCKSHCEAFCGYGSVDDYAIDNKIPLPIGPRPIGKADKEDWTPGGEYDCYSRGACGCEVNPFEICSFLGAQDGNTQCCGGPDSCEVWSGWGDAWNNHGCHCQQGRPDEWGFCRPPGPGKVKDTDSQECRGGSCSCAMGGHAACDNDHTMCCNDGEDLFWPWASETPEVVCSSHTCCPLTHFVGGNTMPTTDGFQYMCTGVRRPNNPADDNIIIT